MSILLLGAAGAMLTVAHNGDQVEEVQCGCVRKPPDLLSDVNMAEGDESAKLWKVNRTIHELVKDRVSLPYFLFFQQALTT